jgi:hypothetical protein
MRLSEQRLEQSFLLFTLYVFGKEGFKTRATPYVMAR